MVKWSFQCVIMFQFNKYNVCHVKSRVNSLWGWTNFQIFKNIIFQLMRLLKQQDEWMVKLTSTKFLLIWGRGCEFNSIYSNKIEQKNNNKRLQKKNILLFLQNETDHVTKINRKTSMYLLCGKTMAGLMKRNKKNPPIKPVIFSTLTFGNFSWKKKETKTITNLSLNLHLQGT